MLALPVGFGIALGITIAQWPAVGFRATHPLMVYIGIATFAWLLPFGSHEGVIHLPSGHSDAAMEENFWEHRTQFEQLARMSNEDTKMTRIAGEFTNLEPVFDRDFTEGRWDQYRRLFQNTGISRGLERYEDGAIHFYYWEHASFIYGWEERGYVYSEKTLQPAVDSLDEIPASVAGTPCIYRHITDNWYMYYGWNDSGPRSCK